MLRKEHIGDFLVEFPPFVQTDGFTQTTGFFAFTTLAQRKDGTDASFRTDENQQARRELEAVLAPLNLTWLALDHGDHVVDIPLVLDCVVDEKTDVKAVHADVAKVCSLLHADVSKVRVDTAKVSSPGHANASKVNIDTATVCTLHHADAAIVCSPGHAAAFTTADCLPVILLSESCGCIVGIHAGWRGIAKGVIENSCERLMRECGGRMPEDIQAWFGPAIASRDYEIDESTRTQLCASPHVGMEHFTPTSPGHFLADLPAIARSKLEAYSIPSGRIITHVESTFGDTRYHSARRDGDKSGRMATVFGIFGRREEP